jgi:hypothetical protein
MKMSLKTLLQKENRKIKEGFVLLPQLQAY